jgi:hypothetical protein
MVFNTTWLNGGMPMSGKCFTHFIFKSNQFIFRPVNKEELFNLYHSSACNVIKQIFSVLKQCFHILLLSLEYKIDIQAHIPAALCAIHNFIWIHDPAKDPLPPMNIVNNNPSHQGYVAVDENEPQVQAANAHCDHIATHM